MIARYDESDDDYYWSNEFNFDFENEETRNEVDNDGAAILRESKKSNFQSDSDTKSNDNRKKLDRLRKRSKKFKSTIPPIKGIILSLRQAAETVKGFGR